MKVLVLGYGSMGKRHVANAEALGHDVRVHDPAITLVQAEATLIPQSLAWATKWDAVVIASPAATHSALLWQAVATGARVYVEKPLGLSVTDILAPHTLGAAGRYDTQVQVGYNLRHHSGFDHGRRYHFSRIGAPLLARIQIACDMTSWPGTSYAEALLELSHELDLALWLFGPATLVGAVQPNERAWELLLRHHNGCATSLRLDGRHVGYRRGGEVTGAQGTWRWDWAAAHRRGRFRTAFVPTGTTKSAAFYAVDVPVEATYRAAMANFLRGEGGGAGLSDGLAVLAICDAARRLARDVG